MRFETQVGNSVFIYFCVFVSDILCAVSEDLNKNFFRKLLGKKK